ncbi:programmed cell death 1 ligand 1-like isoform X2 [Polypterus senegalus]|uniref:programmed cell death 1 ligand 1-like isoform X2 n=1 Tax=Polypterus senegalus TaxID=55291 RepID=UPI00196359C0|nr:programmed cell death 1 ligand 1-like isoform X2 [Polypterus senegalus]
MSVMKINACLVLLLTLGFSTEFNVSIPFPELYTSIQSDVLLPCYFPVTNPKDGMYVLLTWKHNGVELVKFKYGKVQDNSKLQVLETDLAKGNASITLQNVTIVHEGVYECIVVLAPNSGGGRMHLHVTGVPLVSVNTPLIIAGHPVFLECFVSGVYPQNICIEWLKNSHLLPPQEPPVQTQKNPNGTFRAVSHYKYIASREDIGANFSCRVKYGLQLQHQEETAVQSCKPALTVSPNILQKGRHTACKINGCFFSKIAMRWKKGNMVLQTKNCSGVHECLCIILPNNVEEELSCEVDLEGYDGTRVETKISIHGKPGRSYIFMGVAFGIFITVPLGLVIVKCFLWWRSAPPPPDQGTVQPLH